MRRQGAQIAITRLLFLAMAPAVLLFGAEKALSDEPGRIVVQEEPDRLANRPFFKDTTLELHPNQAWAGVSASVRGLHHGQ